MCDPHTTYMTDDRILPDREDVLDSADILLRRITAQLSSQLAHLRPPGPRPAGSVSLTRR